MNNTHRLFPPEQIQEIREIIDQLSFEAANVHLGIDDAPHPDKAAHACRKLIRAYAKAPEQVEWNDVQDALASALAAFDLPEWFLDVPMIDGDRGPNSDCED